MQLITTFLYILFVLSSIVLVVVILLQEGKGGGLTSALGTSGQQTFGVGASGINKFTGWCGAVFFLSALGIHYFNRIDRGGLGIFDAQPQVAPITGGTGEGAGGAPVDGAGGTPTDGTGGAPVNGAGNSGENKPAPGGGATTPPPAGGGATPVEQPK